MARLTQKFLRIVGVCAASFKNSQQIQSFEFFTQ